MPSFPNYLSRRKIKFKVCLCFYLHRGYPVQDKNKISLKGIDSVGTQIA